MMDVYTTLHACEIDMTSLTAEERALFATACKAHADSPEGHTFKQKWLNEVVRFYDLQNLSRRETVLKPLYRAVQDLGSRLMVHAGHAVLPRS